MTIRVCALSGAVFLVSSGLCCGPALALPPVEAFGDLPAIADAQVSPDGRRVALLQSARGELAAAVYTLGAPANARPLVYKPEKDGKVRDIMWASNNSLLVWISVTHRPGDGRTYEFWRILSLRMDGSESKFLFRRNSFEYVITPPALLSMLPNDPDHVLMMQLDAERYDSGGVRIGSKIPQRAFEGISVYKVDLNTGEEERVESAERFTRDWIVDVAGNVRLRIDMERHASINARGPEGGPFREIGRYDLDNPQSAMTFWGFGADPNRVYITTRGDSDRRGVYLYDLAAGRIAEKVFLHDTYDVGGVRRDPYTNRIVGVRYRDHMAAFAYWNDAYASIQKRMQNLFPKKSVSILSMSRDRNAATLLVEEPGKPGAYYFFDAKTRQVSPLGDRYPALANVDLGTVQAISYPARDGLTIPAYLRLPPGREAKNLPLVVLPHGGPEARDDQSFDWWANFYASRGYAVLQPNFRGSSGYGYKFIQAGYGEFGGKMQDDLTDGVRHLVAQGVADPKRVCIVGGSYGGYAALAGAAFTPEIYACAVSVNGVADLIYMMSTEVKEAGHDREAFNVKYWERWLGSRYQDQDRMKAASPARHAGKFQAPVLLMHGKDDTVVSYRQSEIMARALKDARKPHRLIALDGEDHWLSQGESRIRVLRETEAFLKEHIGG